MLQFSDSFLYQVLAFILTFGVLGFLFQLILSGVEDKHARTVLSGYAWVMVAMSSLSVSEHVRNYLDKSPERALQEIVLQSSPEWQNVQKARIADLRIAVDFFSRVPGACSGKLDKFSGSDYGRHLAFVNSYNREVDLYNVAIMRNNHGLQYAGVESGLIPRMSGCRET